MNRLNSVCLLAGISMACHLSLKAAEPEKESPPSEAKAAPEKVKRDTDPVEPVAAKGEKGAPSDPEKSPSVPLAPDWRNDSLLQFAGDLYRLQAAGTPGGENFAFSPVNLAQLLDVLQNISAGDTSSQIARAQSWPLSETEVHPAASLLPSLEGDSEEELTLLQATGLWTNPQAPIHQNKVDQVASRFGAEISAIDFSRNTEAAQQINAFFKKHTRDHITHLVDASMFSSDTLLAAASALYFQGKWSTAFKPEATQKGDFVRYDGSQVEVPLMHSQHTVPYVLWPDGTSAISLDFLGGDMTFFAILPPEGKNELARLESRITPSFLQNLHADLRPQEVKIALPRISLSYDLPVQPQLQSLGVRDLFHEADLSPITTRPKQMVDTMLHRVTFSADEHGAEGAAASVAVVTTRGIVRQVPTFNANRPFLFVVMEKSRLTPVIMGRYAQPSVPEESANEAAREEVKKEKGKKPAATAPVDSQEKAPSSDKTKAETAEASEEASSSGTNQQ